MGCFNNNFSNKKPSGALIFVGIIAIVGLILAAISLGTTVQDNRLSPNVALLNADQAFTEEHGFAETRIAPVGDILDWNLASNQVSTVTLTVNTTLAVPTGGKDGFVYYLEVLAPEGVGLYMFDEAFITTAGLRVTFGKSLLQLVQSEGGLFFATIINNASFLTLLKPASRYSTELKSFYSPESGNLVTWLDQGSNGYNTVTTGTVTITPNSFGTLPGMKFGATGNSVGKASVVFDNFFQSGTNTTIFLVGVRSALTNCTVFSLDGSTDFKIVQDSKSVTIVDGVNEYTHAVTSFVIGKSFVIAVQMSAQTLKIFIDNKSLSSTFPGPFVNKSQVTGVLTIGDALEGSLAECLIYNRALTDQEVLGVSAQLTATYKLN